VDSISNYYYYGNSGTGTDSIEYVDPSESSSVNFQDFLDLMIAQLQNQRQRPLHSLLRKRDLQRLPH
jgi:flagellar hook assembly protein FlgD